MTTTNTTTPIIKVTEGVMAGDVFYGSFKTRIKDKVIDVLKTGKRSNGITRVHEVSVENVSRRIISVYGKILGE